MAALRESVTQALRGARFRSVLLRRPVVRLRHRGLTHRDAFVVSYPRSGTTWMRFLLFEALTGEPSDFEAMYSAIPYVGRHRDAPGLLPGGGRVVFSHETSAGGGHRTVYIVRDPRSVVLSHYRFHKRRAEFGGSFEQFFDAFLRGRTNTFGAWDDHVRTWLESPSARAGDLRVIKFEDLRSDTERVLGEVVAFLGAPVDDGRIARAVANNTLERMRAKEDEAPVGRHFARTVKPEIRFVGSGSASGWRQELTTEQVAAMERRMGETLTRLGYPMGAEAARR